MSVSMLTGLCLDPAAIGNFDTHVLGPVTKKRSISISLIIINCTGEINLNRFNVNHRGIVYKMIVQFIVLWYAKVRLIYNCMIR